MLAARRTRQACGLGLIALAFALGLALATWSTADPSLNHATEAPPGNFLGRPGAIVADLLIQCLGLGATALVIPLALWGIRVLSRFDIDREGARLAAWLLGGVFAAGAAAAIPPTSAWPLPSGLGGVFGDFLIGVFDVILSPVLGGFGRVVGAVVLSVTATLTLAFASTLDLPTLLGKEASAAPFPMAPRPGRILPLLIDLIVGSDDEDDDEGEAEARDTEPVVARARREIRDYEKPPLELLEDAEAGSKDSSEAPEVLAEEARLLEQVLGEFGVRGEIVASRPGPVVTLHELQPAPGVKTARVVGLAEDIARSMSAVAARIATLPGRKVIGIELPNGRRETVRLRDLLSRPEFVETNARLPLVLGRTIGGEPVVVDLALMPHLLVAGATGSGKSVALNAMILSLLYRFNPDDCRLVMIDPKMLELSVYDGIPHLLAPVVTEPAKAVAMLKWTVREMEERYRRMSKLGVRSIEGFNRKVAEARASGEPLVREVQTGFDRATGKPVFERETLPADAFPLIVVVVDEMADLMAVARREVEGAVLRLAQMARAAGIHLVMATQRPSVDVITGTIKANFPSRISFRTASGIDSRTILGEQGAEQLLGQGDMLTMMGGGKITRVHGPFVSDAEVEAVVSHLKRQGTPEYRKDVAAG